MSRARLNKNNRRKGALERLKKQLATKPKNADYVKEQIKILEAKVIGK